MTVLAGVMVVAVAGLAARWAWRYQVRALEMLAPVAWLRRLEVRVTAVVVHDRSLIVEVRDQTEQLSPQTLVVRVAGEHDRVVATLEDWCRDGSSLRLVPVRSQRRVKLRQVQHDRTVSLRLAA